VTAVSPARTAERGRHATRRACDNRPSTDRIAEAHRMNPSMLLPILLVLFAGGMIALQAPTNVMLSRAGGSPLLAALISFAVGTAALLAAWLASGNRPGLAPFGTLPWYAWIGGVYGATYVAVAAYVAPRIGLASLITLGIAGQIAMAMWLDHHGALGLPRTPVNGAKVLGALLVVGGVVLVRRG
jgi:transporter family-2 protein